LIFEVFAVPLDKALDHYYEPENVKTCESEQEDQLENGEMPVEVLDLPFSDFFNDSSYHMHWEKPYAEVDPRAHHKDVSAHLHIYGCHIYCHLKDAN
jgi:hypothetical protein